MLGFEPTTSGIWVSSITTRPGLPPNQLSYSFYSFALISSFSLNFLAFSLSHFFLNRLAFSLVGSFSRNRVNKDATTFPFPCENKTKVSSIKMTENNFQKTAGISSHLFKQEQTLFHGDQVWLNCAIWIIHLLCKIFIM